jgi:ParB family protein of integrating conjugative element (PFGI_1 class)
MSGKRPTDEEISDLLNTPHFGDSGSELPSADPITVMQLVLTLDQIRPYDRNPRRDRNPRFDEIKESIRAQRGLNTPLNITKRPGDADYMVEAGGNTRLQILQELWEEAQEECFYRIHTQYRPWISESHVLTAHLVENELRGEMTLLDKALGLQALREQLEQEAGEALSRNEFLRQLKEIGYSISKRQVIRMQYLAERLYPLIPTVLQNGLVQRDIDHIRDIEKAYFKFWGKQFSEDQAEQFQLAFGDILSQHDSDWDLSHVRTELDQQFSELSGLDANQLQMEVDALLYGEQHKHIVVQHPTVDDESTSPEQEVLPDESTNSATQEKPTTQPPPVDPPVAASKSSGAKSPEQSHQSGNDDVEVSQLTDQSTGPTDLKSLRARNLVLALQISQRNDLSSCIRPINSGMGFVIDLPETSFNVNEKGNGTGRDAIRQFIWWMLMGASEMVNGSGQLWELSNERAKIVLVEEMRILPPLKQGGIQSVIKIAGTPTPLEFISHQFLSNPHGLDEHSFRDLLLLLENCRRLRLKVEDPGDMRLWEVT